MRYFTSPFSCCFADCPCSFACSLAVTGTFVFCIFSTYISSTCTSRPFFTSRYQPLLSSNRFRSCPFTDASPWICGSRSTVSSSSCPASTTGCCRCSISCCTSGRNTMLMRSLLFSISMVTLSAKSSLITLFSMSSRLSIGICLMELLVNAFNSSSFKSYTISTFVAFDWMVSVLLCSSMMIPCDERHSCHFSLEK